MSARRDQLVTCYVMHISAISYSESVTIFADYYL